MINKLISIIIPCYNERDNIKRTYNTVKEEIKKHTSRYEVLFVDNGGSDGQLELMKELYQKDPTHIRVVSLSRNFGYQMSMSAGLEYAKGDAVILIDADLQDPVSLIGKFIEKWKEGFDVVYGVRVKRKGPVILKGMYRLFYWIFKKTSDVKMPLNASEFSLMSRRVVDEIRNMPEKIRFIRGMRAWVGFKQAGIPYTRLERSKGKSKFNLLNSVGLAMDGILSFSTRILTFVTLFGFCITLFSIVLFIYILLWKFVYGGGIPGYAAIMVSISFFSGITIFMMGLVGAFIERIFVEVKSRPKFIVQETLGINQ